MTTLILDVDRSLASIGGEAGVEEALGVRPVAVVNGLADVRAVLGRLLVTQDVPGQHPLLGETVEQRVMANPAARAMGLEALVIDTASTLADQEFTRHLASLNRRRAAKNDPPVQSLDQSTWGPYGDALMALWSSLSQVDLTVVVTCHAQKKEDNETGKVSVEPFIKGSSATKMLRLFDAVLFTTVERQEGDTVYGWHTQATNARPAKVRGLDLPAVVPQHLGALVTRFRQAGTQHPKILIVGESGTGKTSSILTLAPPTE